MEKIIDGFVFVKQAVASGSVPVKVGGVFDASYPHSTTRRGRVQSEGMICPTIPQTTMEIFRIEWKK